MEMSCVALTQQFDFPKMSPLQGLKLRLALTKIAIEVHTHTHTALCSRQGCGSLILH